MILVFIRLVQSLYVAHKHSIKNIQHMQAAHWTRGNYQNCIDTKTIHLAHNVYAHRMIPRGFSKYTGTNAQ